MVIDFRLHRAAAFRRDLISRLPAIVHSMLPSTVRRCSPTWTSMARVGKDTALLETFHTTANSSGQIVIAFTDGAANQPVVMGVEVRTN